MYVKTKISSKKKKKLKCYAINYIIYREIIVPRIFNQFLGLYKLILEDYFWRKNRKMGPKPFSGGLILMGH